MKKENRNRGFTLVELVITVAVLAVIVAPFLSLFVMASGNNLNASKKKDAADVAEDIAEEIKGKTLEVLKSEWIYTDSGSSYEFDIPDSAMPAGVKSGFSARATLTYDNKYNGPIPQLSNIKGEDTALLMRGFYSNDTAGASWRSSVIEVSYENVSGKDQYVVSLKVGYDGAPETEVTRVERDEMPSVYAIYTPMSPSDTIRFVNNLSEDDMEDGDGNLVPLEFYLSVQDVPSATSAQIRDRIFIEDIYGTVSSPNIRTYIENNLENDDRYINIYTNVFDSSNLPVSGSVTYGNTLVKTSESDRFYDLTVEVYYKDNGSYEAENRCAVFKSSKLH